MQLRLPCLVYLPYSSFKSDATRGSADPNQEISQTEAFQAGRPEYLWVRRDLPLLGPSQAPLITADSQKHLEIKPLVSSPNCPLSGLLLSLPDRF